MTSDLKDLPVLVDRVLNYRAIKASESAIRKVHTILTDLLEKFPTYVDKLDEWRFRLSHAKLFIIYQQTRKYLPIDVANALVKVIDELISSSNPADSVKRAKLFIDTLITKSKMQG